MAREPRAPSFSEVARRAGAWLKSDEASRMASLAEMVAVAEAMREAVPQPRKDDWEKLLTGLKRPGDDPRRVARVEGLLRACRLFVAEAKREERRSRPIPWNGALDLVQGLGPQTSQALGALGVTTVFDLLWTLPVAFDDLRAPLGVEEAAKRARAEGEARVVVAAKVEKTSVVPMRGRRAIRVVAEAAGAKMNAWWFFFAQGVLAAARPGTAWLFVGRMRDGKPPRMAHPDLVADTPAARVLRPRYPRLGIAPGIFRKAVADAVARVDRIVDPVPLRIATREGMPDVDALVRGAHGAAVSPEEVSNDGVARAAAEGGDALAVAVRGARERLAWVEAFARVRARLTAEERFAKARGMALPRDRTTWARLRAELGFPLTDDQLRAVSEIAKDLTSPVPMRRLLLGDVGTGKTAVALAAAAQCVAAGAQVAILAPTSLLAEQYLDAVAPLARATSASIALVTGSDRAAARRRAAEGLARGDIQVAIGTHALLSEDVTFAKLGLVVVDEQHRLGVAQRLSLVGKGASSRPHLLTLSATPIPRTLALALRGELATSTLEERPRGRPPVATARWPRGRMEQVVAEIRKTCARGERVFFVSPRIQVTEDDDVDPSFAAVERHDELSRALPELKVALVHGELRAEAKMAAMRAFRTGEAQVLVGTTVIEVGVDVPEATLIVIDGAERFGLAQLHQMRGRVGRGEHPGRCVLLHDDPLDELAAKRLDVLCKLSRGADVARADLELRGSGDLGGTRQSGADEDELLYLDPLAPPPWLARVEADARAIHRADPRLEREEHEGLARALARVATVMAVRDEAG